MKHLIKTLVLGAAIAIVAPLAHADSIQFVGNMSFNTNTGAVIFDNTKSAVYVGGSGTLAPFTTGSATTFYNFNFNTTPPAAGTELVSVIAAAPNTADTLAFFMTSEKFSTTSNIVTGLSSYDFSGAGYYTLTIGTTTTVGGVFDLTSQGPTGATTPTGPLAFSQINLTTVAATPEPSSLIMLGTGLMSAAGMMVRRRKIS